MTNQNCYVRATELIGFEELVDGAGISAAELLIKAGIDPRALKNPDGPISGRGFNMLLEIAAEELNRPSFGLEWTLATPDHFPNLGPLMLLAKLTSNLQEFIDLSLRYWKYHTNDYTLRQLRDPETGFEVLRLCPSSVAPLSRQFAEHYVGNAAKLTRKVTNRENENPTLVRFQHNRPADTTLHERILRCPIAFGAEHTDIVFEPKYLGYETNGGLTMLRPIVSYYIRNRIQHLPIYDQTITRTVALAIPSVIGTGNCNIDFIAASIGLSTKKLRRLLASEDTTFSDILEDVRSNLARQFLKESDAPVGNIAGLLDYSATPPFSLAFKRWTGMSPLEFRKQQRGAG